MKGPAPIRTPAFRGFVPPAHHAQRAKIARGFYGPQGFQPKQTSDSAVPQADSTYQNHRKFPDAVRSSVPVAESVVRAKPVHPTRMAAPTVNTHQAGAVGGLLQGAWNFLTWFSQRPPVLFIPTMAALEFWLLGAGGTAFFNGVGSVVTDGSWVTEFPERDAETLARVTLAAIPMAAGLFGLRGLFRPMGEPKPDDAVGRGIDKFFAPRAEKWEAAVPAMHWDQPEWKAALPVWEKGERGDVLKTFATALFGGGLIFGLFPFLKHYVPKKTFIVHPPEKDSHPLAQWISQHTGSWDLQDPVLLGAEVTFTTAFVVLLMSTALRIPYADTVYSALAMSPWYLAGIARMTKLTEGHPDLQRLVNRNRTLVFNAVNALVLSVGEAGRIPKAVGYWMQLAISLTISLGLFWKFNPKHVEEMTAKAKTGKLAA